MEGLLSTGPTPSIFFLLSQYFRKEHFDTFDNRCYVLRAAFCDSRDVFGEVAQLSYSLTRVPDFFLLRLRNFLCGGHMIFASPRAGLESSGLIMSS